MCGIIGYLGQNQAAPIILDGLKRLEYRGYDSTGIVVINPDTHSYQVIKGPYRVQTLSQNTNAANPQGTCGLGHTRWATHGGVTQLNAHPHLSSDGRFALIHNGVIENYLQIREFLKTQNFTFQSETDTECLVNLIAYHYNKEPNHKKRFLEAVRKSLLHVEGTYGIAVLCNDFPNEIIAARKSSPLTLGIGDNEFIIASDPNALALRTKNVVYLNDDEILHLTQSDFSIQTIGSKSNVKAVIETIDWHIEDANDLGDFKNYMEKEIFEQPSSLLNAMRGRFSNDNSTAHFGGLNISPQELRHIDRILLCACGTAWHACLVAEYLIERYARIPVEVEYASEFRYRNAPLDKNTLVFVISQSGETLDTLAALRESKRKGYRTLAITNVVGSTIARESDGGIYQHAGPEIGVASTKAFTSQLLIVAMVALYLGRMRDMSYEEGVDIVQALKKVPDQVAQILNQSDKIKDIAQQYAHFKDFFFLGRHIMFPIALEGALKLKEISYIHAEGYPAAELKHGPIALICPECPSVFLAPQSHILSKSLSNIQEVKARGGPIIAITTEDTDFPQDLPDHLITIPTSHEVALPILMTVPIQLLSYYIADILNRDVDKPRNLAKSVTVE